MASRSPHAGSLAALVGLPALLALLAEPLIGVNVDPRGLGIDDANIFFVYARNLAAGLGAVWSPNIPPVEGYTSPLWMLLCALAYAVQSDPNGLIASVCAAAGGIAIGCALALIRDSLLAPSSSLEAAEEDEASGRNEAGIIAALIAIGVLWILAAPGYALWTFVTQMDTALWSLGLAGSLWLAVRTVVGRSSPLGLGAMLAILVLTRPEGMAFATVLSIAVALLRPLQESSGATQPAAPIDLRALLRVAAPWVAGLVVLLAIRRGYYGQWLPNTYYAKVGGDVGYNLSEGATYFATYLVRQPMVALVALAGAWSLGELLGCVLRRESPAAWVLAGGLAGGMWLTLVAIYVWVGGDHFTHARQLQPGWPLALVALAAPMVGWLNRPGPQRTAAPRRRVTAGRRAGALLGLAGLAAVSGAGSWDDGGDLRWQFYLSQAGRVAGLLLNGMLEETGVTPRPRVAAVAVGGIGFTFEGTVIDLMGLNDARMAHATTERKGKKNHAAFHIPVFWEHQPELLVHFGPSCRRGAKLENDGFFQLVLRGMLTSERFKREYAAFHMPGPPWTYGVCGYVRRDTALMPILNPS